MKIPPVITASSPPHDPLHCLPAKKPRPYDLIGDDYWGNCSKSLILCFIFTKNKKIFQKNCERLKKLYLYLQPKGDSPSFSILGKNE